MHTHQFKRLGIVVLLCLAFALGIALQSVLPFARVSTAQGIALADGTTPALRPPFMPNDLSPSAPAALSPALSYNFVGGNSFTASSGVAFVRQATGCVNQMPLGSVFSAPVHLPQDSQVVTVTLFSYDSVMTQVTSTASFIVNDGKGFFGYTVSASSRPNIATYQQNDSVQNNPTTIDNQNFAYSVQWAKNGGLDSTFLSLCGVRIAYHAPLGVAALLPLVTR